MRSIDWEKCQKFSYDGHFGGETGLSNNEKNYSLTKYQIQTEIQLKHQVFAVNLSL